VQFDKKVRDLMVPLHEYAVVEEDDSLLDALDALEASQACLPPGRFLHRAVFVRRGEEIVGRIGHLTFLEAFLRQGDSIFRSPLIDAAGVSEEMVATSLGHIKALAEDFGGLCDRARHMRVGDIMRPAALRIDENASLRRAMEMLSGARALALLVTRGREVVGVLRSSDVFTEAATQMRDCGRDEGQ